MSALRRLCLPALLVACLGSAACAPRQVSPAEQRLLDREAIDTTMHRYVTGLDHLDREQYAATFAPDGQLDIDGKISRGRDAMRGVIDNEIAYRKAMQDKGQSPRQLFHMEANVRVSFPDADHAERSAYWVTYQRIGKDPEGLTALGVGTSVDQLQRSGGEWLIARRTISLQP